MENQMNLITELEKQQQALDNFEYSNKSWLEEARKKARHYCYTNQGFKKYRIPNTVTSDDVREMMQVKNSGIRRSNNIMGAVFKDGRFKRVGFYQSKAEGSHGSLIRVWQLKGENENNII